jgi:hypothetical protein
MRHDGLSGLTAAAAIALLVAACSGGGSGGNGTQAPCGAPAGNWQYLSSCDSKIGGIVHQCQDTYATPAAASGVNISLPALCTAFGGKLLSSPCPSANSVGSCIITASTGTTEAELERIYEYAEGNVTAQSFETSCMSQNAKFVLPNGSLPDGGLAGTGASCGAQPAGGQSSGGVAFAIETLVNGQIVECTNYVGTVTAQQLQSVESIGAMTTACPAQNGACACAQAAGSGTFGTTPTLIYYSTTIGGASSACADAGVTCSSTYTPP